MQNVVDLHSVGVKHEDIHPLNILRRPDGRLALIDFHMAEIGHKCAGPDACSELRILKTQLYPSEKKYLC
ncbi:hypothetical protein BT69DRAFT_1277039 [Atractiella rhizophila]|nr:hypothetical protein BT69DRAFT_1277039 [Atractiella rhizophila]